MVGAPKADWLLRSAWAAMRSAWAARLEQRLVALDKTLPPEILVSGHSPSQDVKCLTEGKRRKSGPISLMTFRAVLVPMPGMRVRSTPLASNRAVPGIKPRLSLIHI